ncbi:MAG: hypothetical protein IPQ07_14600 [Myxococcales bacterium]|nr:hypothetical protein [Myxococcales bacterium]
MRWLLVVMLMSACRHGSAPPSPPLCTQAADHVLSLLEPKDDHARDVRGVFETRCTEDRWPVSVRTCIVGTTSLKDPKHCKARLPITVRSHLKTDLATAGARAKRAPSSGRARARMRRRWIRS